MHEHVAPAVYYLEVHLLYASVVCLAAWVLTSLWQGSASWKYWVWVVTLLNFILPFAGFFDRFGASSVSWATQLPVLDEVGIQISRHPTAGNVLFAIWLCGAAIMATRLMARIRDERRNGRTANGRSRVDVAGGFCAHGVPVRFSAIGQEPCVAGVLRPTILLPFGTERLLSKQELDAVLLHELTHARRRDNLIGLVYEIAVCALWFHPLLWLAGFRLATFREFSCDDSVIRRSRGADLVRAMAKLATPGKPHALRAGATTLFSYRLSRLTAVLPEGPSRKADVLLLLVYGAIFLACILETIAHTGSCFKVHL